ncbi:MAG: biotin/lipoyl-binding protein, partial [Bacteroidetes bacterium]|nr:biotin/lipoyl-binding protein [Bacteroidota bacterium]
LILYINANGMIKASEELEISANINGVINTLNIYEGKCVNKNDLLIGLDDREYEIAINDTKVKVTDALIIPFALMYSIRSPFIIGLVFTSNTTSSSLP